MQNFMKIASYIDSISIAILGTIDEDGTPYGAVVFVCTDDQRPIIYFVTKNDTRKYKNLVARPAVSLTMVNPEDNSTLQAKGQASIVHDPHKLDFISVRITRVLASSPEWLPPLSKIRAGEYTMIAIELTEARLAQYKGKQIGDQDIFIEA